MSDPKSILERTRTIAVVGLSTDPNKPAHEVAADLQRAGYRILPVHPTADILLGERVHRRLSDITIPIDLVDVFRPAQACREVAEQAAAVGAGALWLQLGITSPEARAIAEAAGMDYVEDMCAEVERRRHGIVVTSSPK